VSRLGLLPALVAVTLIFTACTWDRHPQFAARPSDIVGTWFAPEVSGVTPTITFSADGTYRAKEIPDNLICEIGNIEPDYEHPIESTGDWSIGAISALANQPHVEIKWHNYCFTQLWTERRNDQVHLYTYVGDPDEDRTVTFSRGD